MQIEAQLGAEGSGVANQQQAEMQSVSSKQPDGTSSSHQLPDSEDETVIPSTLEYIAQQAGINHELQQEVHSQRQDKAEL